MVRPLQPLSSSSLRLYLVAQAVNKAGTTAYRLALGWVVLQMPSASGRDAGLILALGFAPSIMLGPITGALADRYQRRRTILVCQVSLMTVMGILAVLDLSGRLSMWTLIALSLLGGVLVAVDMPAETAIVPSLVRADQLRHAIALLSLVGNVASVVGPLLAGAALTAAPAGWVFLANGSTCGVAALLISRLTFAPQPSRTGLVYPWRDLATGTTHLWRNKDLAIILFLLAFNGAFATNFQIATLIIASDHGGSPSTAATAYAGFAGGCLAGSLLALLLRSAGERSIMTCGVLFAICFGLGGVLPQQMLVVVAAPAGVAWIVQLTSTNAKLQASTGDVSRGRVMTTYITAMCVSGAVGAPLVGELADRLGGSMGMTVAGCACGAVSIAGAMIILIARLGGSFQRVRAA